MNNPNAIKDAKVNELLKSNQSKQAILSAIYNMYVDMLFNYGRCLTNDNELIKDCIHDIFVKLFDKYSMQNINKMSSFLIISLRNRIIEEFRRQIYSTSTPAENFVSVSSDQTTENSFLMAESEENVHCQVTTLMNVLTPRQKEAFRLYYLEEREYNEICQIMHMNYHSIRNLVHRGMLKMRAEVAGHGFRHEVV